MPHGGIFHCLYYDGKLIYNYLKEHDGLFDNKKYRVQATKELTTFKDFG